VHCSAGTSSRQVSGQASKQTMKNHQKHPQKQLLLLPLQSLLCTAAAVAARLLCLLQQPRGNKHDLAPGGQLAALTSCHAHQHLLKATNLQASHTSHHITSHHITACISEWGCDHIIAMIHRNRSPPSTCWPMPSVHSHTRFAQPSCCMT
jgi:hypothetical protein